jgi:hypothetical protein
VLFVKLLRVEQWHKIRPQICDDLGSPARRSIRPLDALNNHRFPRPVSTIILRNGMKNPLMSRRIIS